jgi:hypothetical protein
MTTKVSTDGCYWFWTARRVKRDVAVAAFDKHGVAHLVPRVDHMAAIQEAAKRVADACGLHEAGRIRLFPLAGDKDAVAVEVRRLVKGKSRNQLPFLFSLGVVEGGGGRHGDGTYSCSVLECDHHECSEVSNNKQDVEAAATQVWDEACTYLTANDLTQALVALAKRQHGVLMRDGGGIYAVTMDKCAPYERIAADLAPHGPQLVLTKWDPEANQHTVDAVCGRAREQLDQTAADLIAEVADLQGRGAKSRSNGQRTRMQRLIEAEQMAEHLKKSFGAAFTQSCKALQQAREAIGAEGVRMMRQTA